MKGTQKRMQCPKCGKAFFAWRPDELPGALVKCYFCGNQFEDEAARRKPAPAPAPPAPVPAAAPPSSAAAPPAAADPSAPAPATEPKAN